MFVIGTGDPWCMRFLWGSIVQSKSRIREIVFFGGRGGAEVTADYLATGRPQLRVLGFLNDEVEKGAAIGPYQVLGRFSDWQELPIDICFNAPLHKAKEMWKRAAIIEHLCIPSNRWSTVIHPHTSLSDTATIDLGSAVGAFCMVLPGTRIGRHVALRGACYVGHDCIIEDFAFIGAQAMVAGYCQIGEGAHIGPNSAVRDSVKVGRFAVVGIGSTVVRDVEDFEIVAGNPARTLGYLEK